jgi:hypothetical protein
MCDVHGAPAAPVNQGSAGTVEDLQGKFKALIDGLTPEQRAQLDSMSSSAQIPTDESLPLPTLEEAMGSKKGPDKPGTPVSPVSKPSDGADKPEPVSQTKSGLTAKPGSNGQVVKTGEPASAGKPEVVKYDSKASATPVK